MEDIKNTLSSTTFADRRSKTRCLNRHNGSKTERSSEHKLSQENNRQEADSHNRSSENCKSVNGNGVIHVANHFENEILSIKEIGAPEKVENICLDKIKDDKSLSEKEVFSSLTDYEEEEPQNNVMDVCFAAAENSFKIDSAEEDKKGNRKEKLYACLGNEEVMEDADEDDPDWDPSDMLSKISWFCINCTMPNFVSPDICDTCGESRGFHSLQQDFISLPHLGSEKTELVEALQKRTAIGFDERMLLHKECRQNPHPERPDRLRSIAASLKDAGLFPGKCIWFPAREILEEELLSIHTQDHIDAVELSSSKLISYFTPDTYANGHSALAARLAAGLCADLATAIMKGSFQNGFALVRPPGHHAGVKDIMGFCLHNNAAVAVSASRKAGAKKVLILDWDVHHGNGTQEIFDADQQVLYISLHRHEDGHFYPGTGAATEVGVSAGEGFSVNIPWKHGGVGDNDYLFAFQNAVIPIAKEFEPDFVIISAGFDAAMGDPLGCCEVTPDGFARMTDMLSVLSNGKMLVILEGGYNLKSIATSATAVVKVLLGDLPLPPSVEAMPSKAGLQTLLEVLEIQVRYWPSLKEYHMKLQSLSKSLDNMAKKKICNKKRHVGGPIWWKWSRKRVMYYTLFRKRPTKKSMQF